MFSAMVEKAIQTSKTRHAHLSIVVFAAALLTYLPPALVNEAPFWDDKAYINNALIASGRIEPSQAMGPYAEERPPLFWWLLALLYTAGLPVETARLISPLTASAGVVAVFLLTSKVFKSSLTGLLTALILVVHDYFVLTTSYILTDSLGSILAFLTLACFSLGLRYGHYMWLSGILMSAAILARD
ncbi:MAG: glycosyltransferase family 39 protein, partial [Candidatus Caldarchaeum sp.]